MKLWRAFKGSVITSDILDLMISSSFRSRVAYRLHKSLLKQILELPVKLHQELFA